MLERDGSPEERARWLEERKREIRDLVESLGMDPTAAAAIVDTDRAGELFEVGSESDTVPRLVWDAERAMTAEVLLAEARVLAAGDDGCARVRLGGVNLRLLALCGIEAGLGALLPGAEVAPGVPAIVSIHVENDLPAEAVAVRAEFDRLTDGAACGEPRCSVCPRGSR